MIASVEHPGGIGVTRNVASALRAFEARLRELYGPRLVKLVLFGSRARADARPESDIDVAVVLDAIEDRSVERNRLADAAYDIIVEHSQEIQAWPISHAEWLDPLRHRNPGLVRDMHRDGHELGMSDDPRAPAQSLSLR